MDYLSIDAGRAAPGLRLVLSKGVPSAWGEAAKAILRVKGLAFTPVAQQSGAANEELAAWTGQTSAPVAIYGDERPRSGWAEILLLAERLAPEPALAPKEEAARAEMFGLAFEICGEGGLGWNVRWLILERRARTGGPISPHMHRKYGEPGQAPAAKARIAAILDHLAGRLAAQEARGVPYLVGDGLTALDLYWACFSNMVAPLPPEACPMAGAVRATYEETARECAFVVPDRLIAHRDRVLREHVGVPLDF